MFEDVCGVVEEPVLARLDAVLDDLVALELTSLTGEQLLGLVAGVEARVRRLGVVDHVLLAEAGRRGLAAERGLSVDGGAAGRAVAGRAAGGGGPTRNSPT